MGVNMITISTDLLLKIATIIIAIIQLLMYLVIWLKFRKLSNKSTPLADILKGIKSGAGKLLDILTPEFPNIIGLIKQITGGEKKDDDTDKKGGESNG